MTHPRRARLEERTGGGQNHLVMQRRSQKDHRPSLQYRDKGGMGGCTHFMREGGGGWGIQSDGKKGK